MTRLRFTKMQGLGNDFVVLDGVRQRLALTPALLRRLADRRFGIGCDQVLVVEPASRDDVDFRYRIFNADGGEVEQCGNGARCFVKFVRDQGLTAKREIRVDTAGGVIAPVLQDDGEVAVDMGIPRWKPAEIPFVADDDTIVRQSRPRRRRGRHHCCLDGQPARRAGRCRRRRRAGRRRRARRSSATRAFRAGSTRATCRSGIALTFGCASGSAVRAKRSRAAPAPARRSRRGSCAACWIRWCGWRRGEAF